MNGSQQLVGALGVGLIAANAWTGPQKTQLTAIVTSAPGDPAAAHTALKHLGAEVVGVGALVLIAGTSANAAKVAGIVLVALWVRWFLSGPHKAAPGPAYSLGPPVGTGSTPSGGGVPYTQQIPGLPPIPGQPYPSK